MRGAERQNRDMAIIRCAVARVFTNAGKNGNLLGVVTDTAHLAAAQMQSIARTLGYSETSFVFFDTKKGDYRVRFFTPEKELPFAGHPTLGTLFVLRAMRLVPKKPAYVQVIGARKVPLEIAAKGLIRMEQGKPSFRPGTTRPLAAAMLGLKERDITGEPLVASTGVPHLIIPLKNVTLLRHVRILNSVYQHAAEKTGASCMMPFAIGNGKIFCRMFAPALGIAEDPATGSGCGPLAAYIVREKMVKTSARTVTLEILQGGAKKSLLKASVRRTQNGIESVAVAGFCVMGKPRTVNL